MSSNCSNCSDCYQIGPHKSTVGVNGNTYIQMGYFNNNDNNAPIKLPIIYPKPPTKAQQIAIKSGLPPAPYDLPDYFQDYQLYNTSSYNFDESLKNAYQLPNDKCSLPQQNLWTKNEVKEMVKKFGLEKYMLDQAKCHHHRHHHSHHHRHHHRHHHHNYHENWDRKLSPKKLTEILNRNYVFKYYPYNEMREVLKYHICNHLNF